MTHAIEALTAVNAELVDTNENLREQNARLVQENAELRGKLNSRIRVDAEKVDKPESVTMPVLWMIS